MFQSNLGSLAIIDDFSYPVFIDPVVDGETKVCARHKVLSPEEGYAAVASTPMPDSLLLPEDEIKRLIQVQEETKTRIIDHCDRLNLTVLDQDGTNYCWVNGLVRTYEITFSLANSTAVRFSPASVGAPIKGFRNVGGWGSEALRYCEANGVNTQEEWPANAISRSYFTDANRQKAAERKCVESWTIPDGRAGWPYIMSAVIRHIPVAVGYNWWGHEVTATFLVIRNGEICLGIDNSWGTRWGERGRGVLCGSKKYADDACAVRVPVPLVA